MLTKRKYKQFFESAGPNQLFFRYFCVMDELYYQAVDLLKKLISTPSVSRDEATAASVIEEFIKSRGINTSRKGNNVWATAPDFAPEKPTLLLNSHIDTVRPNAAWTRDPYSPDEDDEGRLYGLGSNDAGASVVSLLAAFLYMCQKPRVYNLVFLASCEEEVSGREGIESAIPLLPPIDAAIVGEPTGMRPAIAEKGLMVLDIEVDGKAGHAARNEGINAIYRAIPVIERLRTFSFPKESETLGPVKISITQIEAGTQHNIVPPLCRMVADIRTTDAYSNEETLRILREAVPECRMTPRSTRLNPSCISAGHPIVRRLSMMGYEPFGSPTLSDQALMPWPSVKAGPGDSSRSHSADEYIYLSEIREAIAVYIQVLSGLTL